MKNSGKIILLILLALIVKVSDAQLKVSPHFNDHLVLQRNKENKIWGTAPKNEKVTLTIDGKTLITKVSKDEKWLINLPSFKEGGPYSIQISTKNEKLTISDVLFGDVWLCSGQSNMEFAVGTFPWGKDEMAKAINTNIRFLDVPNRIEEIPVNELPQSVEWKTAIGENIKTLSAVSYWFAKKLQPETGIPIGLITSDWSGTAVEPWMTIESLKPFPQFNKVLDYLEKDPKSHEQITKEFQEYLKNDWGPKYFYTGPGIEQKWFEPSTDYSTWQPIKLPCWWEDAGIGLENHDGAVWFRTTFDLPENFNDPNFYIDLNLINDYDIVWVNGVKLGETFGDQNWRQYWASRSILKEKGNSLVIRVYDIGGNGGMNFHPLWATPILKGNWVCKKGISIEPGSVPVPRIVNKSPYGYPTAIYNAMIHPLLDVNITGAIWYQGESNAGRAQEYAQLFPAMINYWRKEFNQGEFPFYFVQLANFDVEVENPGDNDWSEVRESQEAALQLPNTGMALAIDLGETYNIHPENKMEVGRRLALHALKNNYGKKIIAESPAFKSMAIKGDSIVVEIETFGNQLICKNKYGYAYGFSIAAEGQDFVWAKAILKGNKIIVYSEKVKNPVAVRYAWSKNPGMLNIYNNTGLPLRPFRTDKRPGITDGRVYDLEKVFF